MRETKKNTTINSKRSSKKIKKNLAGMRKWAYQTNSGSVNMSAPMSNSSYELFDIGERSLEDIKIVLSIEPRHFGALSGQAQIYIELEEYEKAIDSLKKAQEIYPIIRTNNLILNLERLIKEQSI